VWIDYMLYDGVDSLIAMQLSDWGLRVSVENVEWFKARLLQGGDLKAKAEEIETWMEAQGQQYQEMLKQKERSGRLRRRRSQISNKRSEVEDYAAEEAKLVLTSEKLMIYYHPIPLIPKFMISFPKVHQYHSARMSPVTHYLLHRLPLLRQWLSVTTVLALIRHQAGS